MKRIYKTFRGFAYVCVGILFAITIIATAFNLVMPIGISCYFKNPIWLLLYIAEPILLFVEIYLFNLLEDLEWWI